MVTDVLTRFLKDSPSMIEKGVCKRKGCASINPICHLPTLEIDESVFEADLANLEEAVSFNLPDYNLCRKCKRGYDSFERTSGSHLFLEVT